MSVVWAPGYGEDVGREGVGERGRVQDAGGVSVGRHGHGRLLSASSRGPELNIIDFVQYVGEGEKLVKAVFSLARRLSPCVVFIDEIDSLFGARMSSRETGGALAHRGVITEFMSEMDGLRSNSQEKKVIVMGATNRPFDLDDAVLRRLPRRLLVDLPGEKERKEILRILLREENVAEDVDLGEMAKRTGDFSGSDLKRASLPLLGVVFN